MNEDNSTKERLDRLECEVRKTKRYQENQAHKEETHRQLEEALPEKMQADLQSFAGLWADMSHYHNRYCYRRGVDDAVMFYSRIEPQKVVENNPMRESVHSSHGLFSILEGEDFFTSRDVTCNVATDRENIFWEFIKECMQDRVEQIGTEGLKERNYLELDEEIMVLAHRLEDALPNDKRGLVNEYHNLMAAEEAAGEEIFYWQGFMDGVRK